MKMISIEFNGKNYSITRGITILAASQETQKLLQEFRKVEIPTLYYLKGVNDIDDSGVCVVEVDGKIVNASTTRVKDGMQILTNSKMVVEARKEALAKILSIHNKDCINCFRSSNCELQELLHIYGFTNEVELSKDSLEAIDISSMVLVRDNNKCIRCRRCINVCAKTQVVSAICATGEGLDTHIAPSSPKGLADTSCVNCGQCVAVCPVGALYEKDNTVQVRKALKDPKKFVVVQVAPAVRVALGESFEFPLGVDVEGKVAAALRRMGFDKVFDTKFAADLTVVEEAAELIDRIENDGVLPLITSCCPSWIKYCEQFYPDMIDNLSTCKSPQQIFGSVVKSYYAEKIGVSKENIVVVSIMPCIAKKYEITNENDWVKEVADVDISITTNELAKMIKDAEIQLEALPYEGFDNPLGNGTGAGAIFGATGGVMEATLRTAVEKITGEEISELKLSDVRGINGLKEATYDINGTKVKVAVVSGLANANSLLTKIKSGEVGYKLIEIMACPGGCINGGGQPHQPANILASEDVCGIRAAALYKNDENSKIRKSHENTSIIKLYKEYLGEPMSEKSHKLLHRIYI